MKVNKERRNRRSRGVRAFTLLEMVIVLGIIALILATAIGLSGGFMGLGRITSTEGKLQRISGALMSYRTLAGHYPSESQGLQALVERPTSAPEPRRWEKFFDEVPKDAWDREFIYKYPGTKDPNRPEVISKGKDEENSSDDISSQDPK
ncbi:MAG: type II secretion system major pseudopilin GspG [Roseibacillus sp.]|jgi:general secretion pathway protein G